MSLTRTNRRRLPSFSLYGERTLAGNPTDPLHIYDIQSRSREYLWNIGVKQDNSVTGLRMVFAE